MAVSGVPGSEVGMSTFEVFKTGVADLEAGGDDNEGVGSRGGRSSSAELAELVFLWNEEYEEAGGGREPLTADASVFFRENQLRFLG